MDEAINTKERIPFPSPERLAMGGLTKTAMLTLDAHEIEPVIAEDGTATRELSVVEGRRKLIETKTPTGALNFTITHPVTIVSLGESGIQTLTWRENSLLHSEHVMEGGKTYGGDIANIDEINKTARSLGFLFRAPEKESPKPPSKLKAFLGRLSFK